MALAKTRKKKKKRKQYLAFELYSSSGEKTPQANVSLERKSPFSVGRQKPSTRGIVSLVQPSEVINGDFIIFSCLSLPAEKISQ